MRGWDLPMTYDDEGREIRYGRLGDGPPMVLVHGTPWSSFSLRHLIQRLSKPDRRPFRKIVRIDPVALSPWGTPFVRHVNAHEAVVRSYVRSAAVEPLDEATLEGIVSPWTGQHGKAALDRQMAQADSRYTDEVQGLYPTITAPTLIVGGREDSWIPVEQGEELHRMIPTSVLRIVDGAGHLVIEEKPDELAKEILAFAGT